MSHLIYNFENSREHLVAETESYDSAIKTVEDSANFFRNGYRIYEKKLVEENLG